MKPAKIFIVFLGLAIASQAQAVICQVCAVAVGAGLGLSRWMGIDDTITGLWAGAMIFSITVLSIKWLDKKRIDFLGKKIITGLFYYLTTILPLYYIGIIGHPLNKMWGIDKLILGMMVGSVFFGLAGIWYSELKRKNNGKAYFPFQKVAMPIGTLIILSTIFYFLTK